MAGFSLQDLDFENIRIAISNPQTSGAGQWAMLALYGSKIRSGASKEEAFEYLSEVYDEFIYCSSNARIAFEEFIESDTDLLFSYEAFWARE